MTDIIFHSSREYNNKSKNYLPIPAKKQQPDWFSKSSKYWKNDKGEDLINNFGKILGFKSCPALLDSFSLGYLLTTPCDLAFFEYKDNIYVETEEGFSEFCGRRDDMYGFPVPHGYRKQHFHWWPNWSIETPPGYSSIIMHPLNRYDLPFLTTNGIIDSDMYTISGLLPFFLKNDFIGLLPKGTPYAQIIPFKREEYSMKTVMHSQDEMFIKHTETAKNFRVKDGGVYKKTIWSPKKYE